MAMSPAQVRAAITGEVSVEDASPEGIRLSEMAGQVMFVTSDLMPIQLRPTRGVFEALGFVFGEPVDGIFQRAILPEGWTRHVTEHDMWSEIHDEQGRCRIEVFYKAAFYDRKSFARLAIGEV